MTLAERGRASATETMFETPVAEIGDALRATLRPLLEKATARGRQTLAATTIRIEPRDPVSLFSAARELGAEPSLWLQPRDGFALVAMDAAWRVRASGADRFETVGAAWSELGAGAVVSGADGVRGAGPLLLGGFGFSPQAARPEVWQGFEAADLVLPRLLLTVTPGATWLTASAVAAEPASGSDVLDAAADLWRDVTRLAPTARVPASDPGVLRISAYRPDAPSWRATVARFAGAVGRGRIDKVVLARQIDVIAPGTIDIEALLGRLVAAAPESTVFAVTRGERVFAGATPERLVHLHGREFSTVAMAGSTRRASDAEGDALLAHALLRSDKEREEHAVVVNMLRDTLAPLAESLAVAERPSVVVLRHVQHLATTVGGTLREPMGILDLVGRLHPTPAVGGAPRELALQLIADEEPHERGWYAGPLGWLDRDGDGEFVVALRSGVIAGSRATLFAGCGIVADSDPDREWDESLVKLRALGSALGRIEA
ncbi:MAG: isochorismate synthase MenF [Chloroflexota bacterium]